MDGSSSQVLAGLIVTVTDGLSVPTADFVKLIKAHGANNQYLLSKKNHYLITSADHVKNMSMKVKTAMEYGVKVISEDFVLQSIKAGQLVDDAPYVLTSASSNAPKKDMFSYEKEFVSEIELEQKRVREQKEQEDLQKLQERISKATSTTGRQPRAKPRSAVTNVRVVAVGTPGAPYFPEKYELVYYRTLQWTDVRENHNKYYAIEFHKAEENGKKFFRVYTHYGRTDDLVTNPKAGRRECRYYGTEDESEDAFASIVLEKTGQKGYRPVDLAFSNVGSEALKALGGASTPDVSSPQAPSSPQIPSKLPTKVQDLVRMLYDEATEALSNSIGPAKITAKGIETPLGVVTTTQIEKGEEILKALYNLFQLGSINQEKEKVLELSNAFYTAIPHNIGRSKMSIQSSIIQTMGDFVQKEELLQLMRDMLNVTIETKGVSGSDIDMKFAALKNNITPIETSAPTYKAIHDYVVNGQDGPRVIKIENIFSLNRDNERKDFRTALPNQRLLYHGSGVANFVGLLSRGVLMPKVVVSMGGKRRDAGLLGHGIYYGDSASTASLYTTQGKKGTRFMLISNVGLGSTMQYREYALGLTEPPSGYHSVQGVKKATDSSSKFEQNEFVIFNTNQQFQAFLVEFSLTEEQLASKPMASAVLVEPEISVSSGELKLPAEEKLFSVIVDSSSTKRENTLKRSFNTAVAGDGGAPITAAQLLKEMKPTPSYSSGILSENSLKLQPTSTLLSAPAPKIALRASDSVVSAPDQKPNASKDIRTSDNFALNSRKRSTSDVPLNQAVEIPTGNEKKVETIPEGYTSVSSGYSEGKAAARGPLGVSGDASKSLRTTPGNYLFSKIKGQIGRDNSNIKKNEEKLRELFVLDRTNFKLSDNYVSLVDVFKTRDEFKHEAESVDDEKIPKILSKFRLPGTNNHAVVTKDEFLDNFQEFTGGVFKGLNWDNVFVAGGSVLGPLMNITEERRNKSFKDSDIDLFIYGLTAEEAAEKVEEIFFVVQSNTNATGEIVRTGHALTIVNTYPVRHVQIVLRLYKSPAEILLGFDIDSCSVGFNGETVFATARAQRALTKRYNLVDMTRRSLTYESRLYKYAKRGFAVAVPGLFRHLIKVDLYSKRPWQVKGLAKLLLFEHALTNPDGRYDAWKPKGLRLKAYPRDDFSEDRINEFEQVDSEHTSSSLLASDYSNLYFPWGPQWYSAQVVKELEHRDKAQWVTSNYHVALVGLDSSISGQARWVKDYYKAPNSPLANSLPPKDGRFVFGALTEAWVGENENPGKQLLTGSFHPIDDDLWYDDAYVPVTSVEDMSQTLSDAAFGNRRNVLKAVLRKNRTEDVDRPDSFYGRLPLHHALLYGAEECARELIESGADVMALDVPSGFRPIHFAAYSGSAKAIEILARKGSEIVNSITSKQRWTPLHLASYYGYPEAVKSILDVSTTDKTAIDIKGRTAVFLAAIGGHADVLRRLLDAGCAPNPISFAGETAIAAACKRGHAQVAAILAQRLDQANVKPNDAPSFRPKAPAAASLDKNLPLLNAVATANLAEMEKGLQANIADMDQSIGQENDDQRVTALHVASLNSPAATVAALVEKTKPTILNKRDAAGQTALHVAVRYLSVEAVTALVKYNSASMGSAAVRSFLLSSNERIASYPIELDAENEIGQTPLHYVMSILGSFDREDNIDETDGALLALEKKGADQIKLSLLDGGAARPHLNYFTALPRMPSSKYYEGLPAYGYLNPALSAAVSAASADKFKGYLEEEVRASQERKKDNARFDFARSTASMAASALIPGGNPMAASRNIAAGSPNSMAASRNIAKANEKPIWVKDAEPVNELDEPSHKRVRVTDSLGAPPLSGISTPGSAIDGYTSISSGYGSSSVGGYSSVASNFVEPSVGGYAFESTSTSPSKPRKTEHVGGLSAPADAQAFQFMSSQGVPPPVTSLSAFGGPSGSSASFGFASSTASLKPTTVVDERAFSEIDPNNANRFNLPETKTSGEIHRKVPQLEAAAKRSMPKKDGVPSSMAGKALLLVTEWARNRRLNEAQKKALKTLVLTQNSGILAAMSVYELQKDEDELFDSFVKLAHLSYA